MCPSSGLESSTTGLNVDSLDCVVSREGCVSPLSRGVFTAAGDKAGEMFSDSEEDERSVARAEVVGRKETARRTMITAVR